MAHAASTAPRRRPYGPSGGTAHAARNALTRALLMGLVYGFWAAFIERQMGPVNTGNVFYGILCGALFAAVMFGLNRAGPRLQREVRAAAYGAFAGIAVGYLHSLTGASVLRSTVIGLFCGAGVGAAAFYRFYTHAP
ncbi:hypothetical protein AMK16_18615 [Streptomyces sp. CB00455]|uniref:hypothetical protein n=1 Tax=Streptomyces sp. CB00455 TaxID=1703927 RepID=UPI00093D6D15|nr:hypothetical protein [Streptomyces sp. CB00455]OKK18342.1 hypothetical protein AMK16_18615 [Streptomyces sp. CB00455]